jgi:hypothetical protein
MTDNKIGDETLVGLDRMAGCIAVISETITNNGRLILGIESSSFAVLSWIIPAECGSGSCRPGPGVHWNPKRSKIARQDRFAVERSLKSQRLVAKSGHDNHFGGVAGWSF